MTRPALFVDRDGTIIAERHYLRDPDLVLLCPPAVHAMRHAMKFGYALVVVSNQSGVGRGWITRNELDAVHQRMTDLLRVEGLRLEGAFYCTHTDADGCDCRKPKEGLFRLAARNLSLDVSRSIMLGDSMRDLSAGLAAGCGRVALVPTFDGQVDVSISWKRALDMISAGCRGSY